MRDLIFLEGLEVRCLIGIFDWERKIKQKVIIDMNFPAPIARAARRDDIKQTIDYKKIAKRTLSFVSESQFYLIETLADRLARLILKEFRLSSITLKVSKPGAIRGARNVGVQITRRRK